MIILGIFNFIKKHCYFFIFLLIFPPFQNRIRWISCIFLNIVIFVFRRYCVFNFPSSSFQYTIGASCIKWNGIALVSLLPRDLKIEFIETLLKTQVSKFHTVSTWFSVYYFLIIFSSLSFGFSRFFISISIHI